MFPNELGVGAGVGVGVDVGVGDAAGVALGVGVTPGVGVGNPDDPVRRARQMRVIPLYLLNIPPTRSFPSSWMASAKTVAGPPPIASAGEIVIPVPGSNVGSNGPLLVRRAIFCGGLKKYPPAKTFPFWGAT